MLKNSFRPMLEELNARSIPSAGLVPTPPDSEQIHVLAPSHHPLFGGTQGTYTHSALVDARPTYQLSGKVTLAGLGNFEMSGWLQATGTQAGRATGQLILTNSYGSITVELHSGVRPAFSPVPTELVYSISANTGVYGHTRGYGIADFSLLPTPASIDVPHGGAFGVRFS